MKFTRRGFTLVEIMIVVAVIGILAAIAIPNWANARKSAEKATCHTNAKTLQDALDAYSATSGNSIKDLSEKDILDTISSAYPNKHMPACPAKGYYYTDEDGYVMCNKHGSSDSSVPATVSGANPDGGTAP